MPLADGAPSGQLPQHAEEIDGAHHQPGKERRQPGAQPRRQEMDRQHAVAGQHAQPQRHEVGGALLAAEEVEAGRQPVKERVEKAIAAVGEEERHECKPAKEEDAGTQADGQSRRSRGGRLATALHQCGSRGYKRQPQTDDADVER